MIHRRTITELYQPPVEEIDEYEKLRFYAASKLLTYSEHEAGHGSLYIYIGDDLKIRIADHKNTSVHQDPPDYNIVKRDISEREVEKIRKNLTYPELCKQKAFALHVGLTIPKVKKLLPDNCFVKIAGEYYTNTYTTYVKLKKAFAILEELSITDRFPVRQETLSVEDYFGVKY